MGWLEREPKVYHGHESNLGKRILALPLMTDARAFGEFRAAYKKKIDQGMDVLTAVEDCYCEMLTPQQMFQIGGVEGAYKEAHRYMQSRKTRLG